MIRFRVIRFRMTTPDGAFLPVLPPEGITAMSLRQMLTTLVTALAGLLAAWSYRPQQPPHTAPPAPHPLSVTVEAPGGVRASTRGSPSATAHGPSVTEPAAVPLPASSAPAAGESGRPGRAGPAPAVSASPAPTTTARSESCTAGVDSTPADAAVPGPDGADPDHTPTQVPDPTPTTRQTPLRPVDGGSSPSCPAVGTTPATGRPAPGGKPPWPLSPQTTVTVLPLWEAVHTDLGRKG